MRNANQEGVTCTAMAVALIAQLRRITGKPVYMAPDHTGKHDDAARAGVVRDIVCLTRSHTLVVTTPSSTFAQWVAQLHSGCHACGVTPTRTSCPAPSLNFK